MDEDHVSAECEVLHVTSAGFWVAEVVGGRITDGRCSAYKLLASIIKTSTWWRNRRESTYYTE